MERKEDYTTVSVDPYYNINFDKGFKGFRITFEESKEQYTLEPKFVEGLIKRLIEEVEVEK